MVQNKESGGVSPCGGGRIIRLRKRWVGSERGVCMMSHSVVTHEPHELELQRIAQHLEVTASSSYSGRSEAQQQCW